MSRLDELIAEAGQTHVIPPREDERLLKRLRDPQVLARAKEVLRSKDRELRRQAILCTERVGYALRDQETAEVLLEHADRTKDKYEVATALDGLRNLHPPQPLPPEPLLRLAHRPEWLVWHSAIRCLHLAPAYRVERALFHHLDADRYGLVNVAYELRYMRSVESIRAPERLLGDASLDVRCVSLGSLGQRLGEGVAPYARRLAAGRQWQEKMAAEEWLARFGDAEDAPFMVSRLKSVTTGKRRIEVDPPEVSVVVPFLLRHRGDARVQATLDGIQHHRDRLAGNERGWLEQHAPEVLTTP